ncbi:thiamine ABC transporter substrate-binding protein [Natronosalvus amylolyticus]|uniref:thiamine ABC transporter substrate-binding protein n=1 Tax=Natronosalvus amylolyticus TaxID=2961994 RepID=UPI0020C981C4|nr:thiamine ABC transporter substrate-binding protein [Natronosalvus amylolyticus]
MKRRTYLSGMAAGGLAGLAGCLGSITGDSDDDTLHVATYNSFIDAPSDSPGVWIKDEFEERYDATLEWHTPEQELNYFIERHNEGVDIEPDLYYGLSPHELLRADENTDDDLFVETDRSVLSNAEDIGEHHEFDPQGRVIPTYRSLCAIVYDGRNVEKPETFEDLLDPAYEGKFAVSNPQRGTTGQLFMLWSINEFGDEGEYTYLDYWQDLLDNDTRVLDSWSDVYTNFENDDIPVIVSYANDRVYAKRFDNDLEKHRVALLNDQAYANYSGIVRFAESTNDDLAHEFMDFVLEPEVQAVVAERNVTGPTNDTTELPEVFEEYAQEPEEAVFFDYEDLQGNLSTWLDDWGRTVVDN